MSRGEPIRKPGILVHRLVAPLRTPAQRGWFVVAALGFLLMLAGVTIFASGARYGEGLDELFRLAFDRLTFQLSDFEGRLGVRTFQVGLLLTVIGSVFAYLYDLTLGALLGWVLQGGGRGKR